MTKANIIAAQGEIAEVVSQAVVETFNTMFGRKMLPQASQAPGAPDNVVLAGVKLNHGQTEMDFYFRFDIQLLLQAAASIFTPEYIQSTPVAEDLACEIANIVCQKVKTYLTAKGYVTDMGFPFVPKGEEAAPFKHPDYVHMHFFYTGKSGKQDVGVAINFTVK